MVIGFLKDNRFDRERKCADDALAESVEMRAKIAAAQVEIAAIRAAADQERERSERCLAELERLRESYVNATDALVQRLRQMDDPNPSGSDNEH